MRGVRRHRALWLACVALSTGLLAIAVGGASVGAALSRGPAPGPPHQEARSATSAMPRMKVEAPGGPVHLELSPTDGRMSVRRKAVRITIVCPDSYQLLVRSTALWQNDGRRKASPEHLLIRRSVIGKKWTRLSSEWVELADEHAVATRRGRRIYTFDVASDFGAGDTPWVLAGGDYLGRLEFRLRVASPAGAGSPPSAPDLPRAPHDGGSPGRGRAEGAPPKTGPGRGTPVAPPPAVATETVPPPSEP